MRSSGEGMSNVLIVGYGNPLRGDDAAGWIAVERLREIVCGDEGVQTLAVHQLMPELAEPISQAELVIFIDAAAEGDAPGSWKCRPANSIAKGSPSSLAHHVTPAELLAYAQCVFHACPRALIYTIGAESFELGAPLSSPVKAALDAMTDQVLKEIRGSREAAKA